MRERNRTAGGALACVPVFVSAVVACSVDVTGLRADVTPVLSADGGSDAAACVDDTACPQPTTTPAVCAIARCDRALGRCHLVAVDADRDGHAARACVASNGESIALGDDCDDADPAVFPGAWDGPLDPSDPVARPDRCAQKKDHDCNGTASDGRVARDGAPPLTCACDATDPPPCAVGADGRPIPGLTSATAGVGVCKLGTSTCADGAASTCMGAVGPEEERCDTPADENCLGATPDCGAALRAARYGDADEQFPSAIAVDAAGNVALGGVFASEIAFESVPPLTATGLRDGFVAKLDPAGAPLWSRQLGSIGQDAVEGVAVDGTGNVWVVGRFEFTMATGGPILTSGGSDDMFVVKLAADGTTAFAASFGDQEAQRGDAIAVDATGAAIVAGTFAGTLDFGGTTALKSAGGTDAFVLKLSPTGAIVWAKCFGDDADQAATTVAVDGAGNVVLGGELAGSMTFGAKTLTSRGNRDAFVAKLDAAGNPTWAERYGDGSDQRLAALAVDGDGAVVLTGKSSGSMSFGGPMLVSAGDYDIFLAKLDRDGAHLWSKSFGDGAVQTALGVAVTPAGSIYLVGELDGTVSFGGPPLGVFGRTDAFVARFTGGGGHLWSHRYGDGNLQGANAVAVDPGGNAWVAGDLTDSISFGARALTSSGSWDVFVARLAR